MGSIKDDVVKGTGKSIFEQLTNSQSTQTPPTETPEFDFEEWMIGKEEELKEEGRQEQKVFDKSGSLKENIVFSYIDEKLKKEIAEVRQELQLLIQAMNEVSKEVEKAIIQEIVEPGTYHLNYFAKIKTWLKIVRKGLQSTDLWQEMWTSRSKRSYFWKMAKKKGTSFTLSHERTVATQTG